MEEEVILLLMFLSDTWLISSHLLARGL